MEKSPGGIWAHNGFEEWLGFENKNKWLSPYSLGFHLKISFSSLEKILDC